MGIATNDERFSAFLVFRVLDAADIQGLARSFFDIQPQIKKASNAGF